MVENNLDLRIDKREFLHISVKYLGYFISGDGIRTDEKGLEAIKKFPISNKQHSLQPFLGLCSYIRKFFKDFSLIAKLNFIAMLAQLDLAQFYY